MQLKYLETTVVPGFQKESDQTIKQKICLVGLIIRNSKT